MMFKSVKVGLISKLSLTCTGQNKAMFLHLEEK